MFKTRFISMLVLLMTVVTGAWALTGMTNGLFSVSATKRVYFSKGNLQLVGENTFQFAENQWDYFGNNQSDNHRDLFSWGTGNNPNQTTGNSTFTDWGDNTYLQATLGKGWRTMTQDEFAYVFNTRASGSSVFGNANGRYTMATITTDGTGVNGLILFPDGITIAASEVTTAGTINNKGTVTQCTTAQWAALAEKGCVFLPAGGYFLSGGAYGYGDITDYWSSTAANASKAYNLGLNFGVPGAVVNTAGTLGYNYGCSVRLVIDDVTVYTFYHDLTLADGTEDAANWQGKAGEGKYQELPLEGVFAGTAVSVKYNGMKHVKSVKAKKKVKPAATVTTAPTAKTGVKAGQNEAIVNEGTAEGGTMMYMVNATQPASTDGFSATVPTAEGLTAGTYYVWYYVKADDSHTDSEISATGIEVTIAAPAATVTTAPTAKTGVKAGQNEAIVNAGTAEGGTMMYMVNATQPASTDGFSATVPTAEGLTAGTYYVWYYVKADDSHTDSEISASGIEVTIAAAGPTLAATMTTAGMTVKVNFNYDGENYCVFLSDGNGNYTFQSGYGSFGGNDGCAKALVVEGSELVFSLVDHPDFADEYSWYNSGFLVAFDTSNNTYSQWKGENVGNRASFISVEVNGTQIAVTQQ